MNDSSPSISPWREFHLFIPNDFQRFEGHFPQNQILPAVSQMTDFILPHARASFGGGALLELRRVKWLAPLRPGTSIILRLKKNANTGFIRFELLILAKVACLGSLRLENSYS